jgi:hypothetical protein
MAKRPPCPDPDRYVWIQPKDGKGYWRLKRGEGKEATLNESLQINSKLTGFTNKCANNVIAKLGPYLNHLARERFVSRLSGALKRGFKVNDTMDYGFVRDMEVQKRYPLGRVLSGYTVAIKEDAVEVSVDINIATIKTHGKLATHYFLELILLQGDASEPYDMRIEDDSTDVYPIDATAGTYVLRVHPTRKLWMAFLKLTFMEAATPTITEMAVAGNNYGMKCVAVS